MDSTTPRQPPAVRAMLVPAYGPPLLTMIGTGAVIPIIALQARALGASVGEAALMMTGLALGTLLMALPAGALIARIGERWALTVVGIVDAVLFLVAWRSESLPAFAACMTALGATSTVAMQARQGFMIDAFPDTHRARAMSMLGGVFRLGMLLGPLLGAGLIHAYGLSSVFVLAAGFSAASVVLVQTMPAFGDDGREDGGPLSVLSVLRAHVRVLATVGTAGAVIQGARALRFVLLPLWADHVGMSAAAISLMVGIASLVDLAFVYPAGWVMDAYGRAPVALCVVGTTALGCLLLPLTDGFGSVLAVLLLISAGNGMGAGILMTLGADTAPVIGRAQYLGGLRLMGELGSTTSPLALAGLAALLPLGGASVALGGLCALGAVWATGWARVLDRRRTAASAPSAD